jgi:hypothetical protein
MCGCISDVNNLLREHNTCLVTTMFRQPETVAIRTDKIQSKVRKGPMIMLAAYCPFCGEKYGADKSPEGVVASDLTVSTPSVGSVGR